MAWKIYARDVTTVGKQLGLIVADGFADLPTTGISPGAVGFVESNGLHYFFNGSSWSLAGGSSRLPSWNNPPASAHAYNDEFNAGALDAKWTVTGVSTTNAPTTGTLAPIASLTTPIYDLASNAGWLAVQSDNSAGMVRFSQSVSLDADCTFFLRVSGENRNVSADGELGVGLMLMNSADANETVHLRLQPSGSSMQVQFLLQNNGAFTDSRSGVFTENAAWFGSSYLVLWKNGNSYRAGHAHGEGMTFTNFQTTHTKTGVTTFDRIVVGFWCANETPSGILGADFFRYYPSLTMALVNP